MLHEIKKKPLTLNLIHKYKFYKIRCLGCKPQRQLGNYFQADSCFFKRASFTSLSMVASLNVFKEHKFRLMIPQHPQVLLLVYSSVQITTLHQGYSRDLLAKTIMCDKVIICL